MADATGDPFEDYPEDQGQELKPEEIIKIASELKEFGNKAYKSGDFDLGLDKYQKGLRYLREYSDEDDEAEAEGTESGSDIAKQIHSLKFILLSNSALVQVKLKSFEDALASASLALDVSGVSESDRAKAYYRRALARTGLNDDEDAIRDLEEASKLAPGDGAITKELSAAKKRIAERIKKEKAAYKKFFE